MKRIRLIYCGVLAVMALMLMTGCKVPQDVAYFQDLDAAAILENVKSVPFKVKAGDKLAILVKSKDPQISNLFNLPVYSNRIGQGGSLNGNGAELRPYTGGGGESVADYTVTPEGTIDFPVLGVLKIAGMTRSEVAGFIKGEIMGRQLAKDVVVTVEFLNAGISVIGDVSRPGRFDMNRDDLTVLEAISLAGDLMITGQRNNVKVLRKENGKIRTYVLDLTDANSLTSSPAYYLQQDDVIYVEPNKMRKRSTTVNGNNALSVSFWISVASLLTSVITTVAVFINK